MEHESEVTAKETWVLSLLLTLHLLLQALGHVVGCCHYSSASFHPLLFSYKNPSDGHRQSAAKKSKIDQVQGVRLTQQCLNACLVFYSITATCFGRMTIFKQKYLFLYAVRLTCFNNLKLGCLHPVACTRSGSGSGFPSNATLFEYNETCSSN
jgi:hypothetical protein